MSYDIRLLDPVTRETVEVEAPHLMQGGTYALGGTTELWLNAIPLDTEILYTTSGQVFQVGQFRYSVRANRWFVYGHYEHQRKSWIDIASCFLLTPPDSWEKLEEDAKVKACDYAHAPRDEYGGFVCCECRFRESESCQQAMVIDMIARAKKLAGIEGEQR